MPRPGLRLTKGQEIELKDELQVSKAQRIWTNMCVFRRFSWFTEVFEKRMPRTSSEWDDVLFKTGFIDTDTTGSLVCIKGLTLEESQNSPMNRNLIWL